MDNLTRDLTHLDLLSASPFGQEFLAPTAPIRDFITYYFTRFVSNLATVFKDFRTTEIADFNQWNKSKLPRFLNDPAFTLGTVVIPIPRAMVGTYAETLARLKVVLATVAPERLLADLEELNAGLVSGYVSGLKPKAFDKASFASGKREIGSLYGRTGLTHVLAPAALVSQHDIRQVNDELILLTSTYYPQILKLQPLLLRIEASHARADWTDKDKVIVSSTLMSLAYRLSLFAVVMEHVQDMEHSFVLALEILLNQE